MYNYSNFLKFPKKDKEYRNKMPLLSQAEAVKVFLL